MIKINKIKCCHCEDEIESKYRWDFNKCSCGAVAVDGGRDYLKRLYKSAGDYIELSIETNDKEPGS
jgi:hypothetical protein